jgi:hypothetical protein
LKTKIHGKKKLGVTLWQKLLAVGSIKPYNDFKSFPNKLKDLLPITGNSGAKRLTLANGSW